MGIKLSKPLTDLVNELKNKQNITKGDYCAKVFATVEVNLPDKEVESLSFSISSINDDSFIVFGKITIDEGGDVLEVVPNICYSDNAVNTRDYNGFKFTSKVNSENVDLFLDRLFDVAIKQTAKQM